MRAPGFASRFPAKNRHRRGAIPQKGRMSLQRPCRSSPQEPVMNEASIFAAALEKATDAERAAFVAEACGGDAKLRRRVEALLRAHAEPDDVLDPPTCGERAGAYHGVSAASGEVIGPYKLVE